jgi:cytochrome P450
MVQTVESVDVGSLPLAPKNPLPYWHRLTAMRAFHTGPERLRDAGGAVTRTSFCPKWLSPPLVLVTSPQGARDVLGRTDAVAERGGTPMATEMRRLMGGNLLVLPHDEWLPRRRALQPLFTKQHVPRFAGHMADAAERLCRDWAGGGEVDIDTACRALTLRALGRSVLGLDLDERAEAIGPAVRTALQWVGDRAVRPVNPPQWLPTPAQRRARAANAVLHDLAAEILHACRADPDRDAPLVQALLAAPDPATGRPLTDGEICDELVLFMLAGHDTTATTLCYALWALGHHRDMQDRVAAEVAELGDRTLTPDDVPRLRYIVQVLHEALRLCPPAAAIGRMVMQDIEVDG